MWWPANKRSLLELLLTAYLCPGSPDFHQCARHDEQNFLSTEDWDAVLLTAGT